MCEASKAFRDIGLVCRAGLDIASITPILCRLIRTYIGAAAVAIFWMDERGMPAGFHHEDSPPGARDLFANEFETLFLGPSEINVAQLASEAGPQRAGFLLAPPESYFRSNTFNLLVRPSGHQHCIDLRVDWNGRPRIVVLSFRERSQPFAAADVERLGYLEPALRTALREQRADNCIAAGAAGHIVIDNDAATIRFLDGRAHSLLQDITLVGQQIRVGTPLVRAPRFLVDLCDAARHSLTVCQSLVIPSGRLLAEVAALSSPSDAAQSVFMVRLQHQMPAPLLALERVLDCKLSPTQKLLILEATRGTRRLDAASAHRLSNEALKKHLAAIYTELDVGGWEEIGMRLLSGSGGP